jgi:putative Mn2+ efflux pump MntP
MAEFASCSRASVGCTLPSHRFPSYWIERLNLTFGALLLLALGLAMDATAVSAARGLAVSSIRIRHVLSVALFFGGFQALMPLIGWLIGSRIGPLVRAWDHWVALVLLAFIGGKMLWEGVTKPPESPNRDEDLFGLRVMLVLAVATSIDALAVGITLPMLDAPLVLSVATIGITTAVLSAIGLFAGRRFGAVLGKRLDIAGGLVLIGLGIKIVIEHLTAG